MVSQKCLDKAFQMFATEQSKFMGKVMEVVLTDEELATTSLTGTLAAGNSKRKDGRPDVQRPPKKKLHDTLKANIIGTYNIISLLCYRI